LARSYFEGFMFIMTAGPLTIEPVAWKLSLRPAGVILRAWPPSSVAAAAKSAWRGRMATGTESSRRTRWMSRRGLEAGAPPSAWPPGISLRMLSGESPSRIPEPADVLAVEVDGNDGEMGRPIADKIRVAID
jgi:hypothetical protein